MLEINSKSKSKCLRKVILEKKNLEGSQILLFKQTQDKSIGISLEGGPKSQNVNPMLWVPFTEKDSETPVKDFQNVAIAFKIYLDISINVEGRSYTFKQDFQVDPKDKFEATLRSRTKTWSLFMTRGRCTCVVKVEYKKKNMEDGYIPPTCFDKTFEDLGIVSGAQLVIIEMRNIPNYTSDADASEGGEDEMEEHEEEMDEGDLEDGSGEGNEQEGAEGSQKVDEDGKIVDG